MHSQQRTAYILLTLTSLFWAGNFVLARAVHESVPPVGLAFWRWFAVAVIIVPWAWSELREQWPLMRAHPWLMIVYGVFSVGAFNTLMYIGLQTTSAVSALLLISSAPVFILLFAPLMLGSRLSAYQALGVLVSALGVLLVLTHGDLSVLEGFGHNVGVLWALAGVISWAFYSVLLHRLPKGIGGQGFFAMTVIVGVIAILPFYLIETFVQERPVEFGSTLLLTVAYIAFFASILAYTFWNKGVSLIGAERAGAFIHLMPAFGLVLSAMLLGEQITSFDLGGLALIVAGLLVAAGKMRFVSRDSGSST
ncbi:DMT family transporter [Thiomicrorhabdus sp.]|uniref:DMT family transporter n=1 Tax=Thiomicrorhabdus sp. TaxID=2039724 RepID=UPI0029C87EE1|nr:DMT family transporter [Thiomicrorhabdus sp.]